MNDSKKKELNSAPLETDCSLLSDEQDRLSVSTKITQQQNEVLHSTQVITEAAITERLACLRESHELVEDDSDMIEIFMLVRSNDPMTKKDLLKAFPQAKAIVITQEQLWQIEAGFDDDTFFCYMNTANEKKYVRGDDLNENQPLILFIEDFGD